MAPFHASDNPFPGIRSYEIQEDELFFGREKQVTELIEKLARTRFLAIVGSSGCGKSSLIKAGVIPALLKNKSKLFSTRWKLNIFRPGDDPIGNMARSIAGGNHEPEELAAVLRSGRNALTQVLREQVKQGQESALIIIDQFEELFRFHKSRSSFHPVLETAAFVDLLLAVVEAEELPVYIILSMRTDFLDECTEFRGLSEVINTGYYLVPRMNNEERRLAITGPVGVKGCAITDELVERLLSDVGDDPDQLPILQHAMMRTWEFWALNRIGDQPIGEEHYVAIGTMKEALSVHLEEIYAELRDEKSKYIAEKLFKALTDISRESRGTRRPTVLGEIMTLAEAREEEVVRVIDSFRNPGCAFLMPSAQVMLNPDSTIDISHESIMRVWSRLRKWVEEEGRSAELYLRLSKSAELYQEGRTGLWINPELQLALQWKDQAKPNATWAMRYDPAFDRAMNFLQYSKKQQELEQVKKENQQIRNLKRARMSAFILGIASLVSILFLLISLNLRFKAEASRKEALEKEKLAVFERKRMEEQRKEAILQKKISEQQQLIAEQQKIITEEQRQYAVRQQEIAQVQTRVAVSEKKKADESRQEALNARDEAQSQRKEAVAQKQIADRERMNAEESEKNTRRLRLLAVSRSMAIQAGQLHTSIRDDLPALLAVESFRLNQDNGGAADDPAIYAALSAISGDQQILRGHEDAVRSIVLSHDGTTLYSCSEENRLLIRHLSDNQQPPTSLSFPKQMRGVTRTLALTPDDGWLIAGTTGGDLVIWNRKQPGVAPQILRGHAAVVNDLAVHPSGKRFVSAGSDGKLIQWTLDAGNSKPAVLDSVAGKIAAVVYTPDGALVAYAPSASAVRTIRPDAGTRQPMALPGSTGEALSLSCSPDGKYLAAGLSNGTILAWDLADRNSSPIQILGRHLSGVSGLAFSPGSHQLASCGFDRSVKLAGFPNPETSPITIGYHDLWVYDLLFTPDGSGLISASADKTIRMSSTRNARLAENLTRKLTRNLTADEWAKMVGGDIPYRKTREDLPAGK